jgi:hypothetical protein
MWDPVIIALWAFSLRSSRSGFFELVDGGLLNLVTVSVACSLVLPPCCTGDADLAARKCALCRPAVLSERARLTPTIRHQSPAWLV